MPGMPYPLPFVPKSYNALVAEMKGVMNAIGIGNVYDAGKAWGMLRAVAEKMRELHKGASDGMTNVNVDTSSDVFLDMMANSVGVLRIFAEPDEVLRERTKLNVFNQMMANDYAVDTAIRSHPRVDDVTYYDYAYGAGSFAAFISPPQGAIPDGTLIRDVGTVVTQVKAKGVMSMTMTADYLAVRMTLLARGRNIDDLVRETASANIESYIRGLQNGETMFLDHIRGICVDAGIDHVDFNSIHIANKRVLPRDFTADWDERLVPDPATQPSIQVI